MLKLKNQSPNDMHEQVQITQLYRISIAESVPAHNHIIRATQCAFGIHHPPTTVFVFN